MTDSLHDRSTHAQLLIDTLSKEATLESLEKMNELRAIRDMLSIQKEINLLESHAQTAETEKARDLLEMEYKLAEAEHKRKKQKLEHEVQMMELEKDKRALEFDLKRQVFTQATDLITAELAMYEKELAKGEWTHNKAQRLANPIVGHSIVVSDRQIALDGPITYKAAKYVTDRINYYNNSDPEAPIFLVIGSSPGGSVLAGLEILANIEYSQAPVYTIVKSYAASMAAVIATRTHSYMYTDALILHHQMWTFTIGNLTAHAEQLKFMRELSTRTDAPMLEKINARLAKQGIDKRWTTEEWTHEINSKDTTHCWMVHGDEAAKLGWVDATVSAIRFTSTVRHPDAKFSVQNAPPPAPPLPSPGKEALEPLVVGDQYVFDPTWYATTSHSHVKMITN